jgi:hypothetical protein
VPEGHAPFAVLNRTGNRALALVLRTPLHPIFSGQLALITVTGRRSGREHTLPVMYKQAGNQVTIEVGWPERKLWWRNLRDGAPARLLLRGKERTGHAKARGDEQTGVVVEVQLNPQT